MFKHDDIDKRVFITKLISPASFETKRSQKLTVAQETIRNFLSYNNRSF